MLQLGKPLRQENLELGKPVADQGDGGVWEFSSHKLLTNSAARAKMNEKIIPTRDGLREAKGSQAVADCSWDRTQED